MKIRRLTRLVLVLSVIMFLTLPAMVMARPPPEPPPPPPPPPQIDMDVLILYDDSAVDWFEAKMGTTDIEEVKEGMVEDVLKLNYFFHQYWDNIDWYADTDWMVYDADGYSESYDNREDYYRGWQEENGWPYQEDPWWGWNHIGMDGDGYTDLHGRHFDYLVMYSQYVELNPFLQFGGMNEYYHNAAWVNLHLLLGGRAWTTSVLTEGSWSVLCHEVGHGYGLLHGTDQDIMDVGWKWDPNWRQLSAMNKALIYPVLNGHCETFWNLDSGYSVYTSPAGRSAHGYSISNSYGDGYHVDTDGCYGSGYNFFGYAGQRYYADEDGAISGSGYFKISDTLPSYYQYNYRMMKVYILNPSRYVMGQAYLMRSWDGVNTWKLKSFTISGLTSGEPYYIAFGRYDFTGTNYHLTAEWAGVAITNRAV